MRHHLQFNDSKFDTSQCRFGKKTTIWEHEKNTMSGPKERDEQEALKLDECFKDILERVTPYILKLNVDEENKLCRVWLDKLSCASSQRALRNQYLLELCRHLKSGHIGGIFGKPPRNGPLAPLSKNCNHTLDQISLSQLSDTSSVEPHESCRRFNAKRGNKMPPRQRSIVSESSTDCDDDRTDRNESSAYRRQLENMIAVAKELKIQNEGLKRDLIYARNNSESKENCDNLRLTIQQLTGEIASLRAKLMEVKNMKDELEKNHRDIVQHYKLTMTKEFDQLNQRLEDANSKNVELNEIVEAANRRAEETIREKEEKLIEIEQNSREQLENAESNFKTLLAEKNEELLMKDNIINEKDSELAEIDKLRREKIETLNNRINELEEKLRVKNEDEEKLRTFIKEQCSTMKDDLVKMRADMESASQTQNHNMLLQISSLKRVILKLEKSKKKLGLDCAMKISHVLETKELEIKSLQLQLQEQRSELTTSLSSEKQFELDRLVGDLEKRYKGLLSTTDANAGNERKNFLARITTLEDQMTALKRSLEYDIDSTVV